MALIYKFLLFDDVCSMFNLNVNVILSKDYYELNRYQFGKSLNNVS